MINKRVKISTVVESQLPSFVRDNYPLAIEFLKTYYRSQDSQSLPSDILSNIDQYVKIDNLTNLTTQTSLGSSVSINDTTIQVSSTEGFPDQYGIIQIDSEIITYTGITTNTFTGCVRGFSGISSYHATNKPDELVFSSSSASSHNNSSSVKNLSILFLQEFFKKIKRQIAPGFENRNLYQDLNKNLFIKQAKDFYSSKGSEQSYEILFRALYGEDVELIRPSDHLFIPSDAGYRVTDDLVVESISGDPELLVNRTLFQDKNQYHNAASAAISNVEKISRGDKNYYVLSLDADYGRDIDTVAGSVKGQFSINPKTKLLNNVSVGASVLDVDSTVGFAATGQVVADLPNGTSLILTYLSKSSNQFFDVSGVSQSIGETQEIRQNTVAYGYTSRDQSNPVTVRIGAVLEDLVIPDKTFLFEKDDSFEIQTLGKNSENIKTKNWFYNIKGSYKVKRITENPIGSLVYNVETYDKNVFNIGDIVELRDTTSTSNTFTVKNIINDTTFVVSGISIPTNRQYNAIRHILKGSSNKYPYVSNFVTNVQNVYLDKEDVYVASNSLPSYSSQTLEPENFSVTFSGSFSGTDLNIGSHPFYTGDAVEYVGEGLNISSGTYFVKVLSPTTIRLSASKPNISNEIYFNLNGTTVNSKLVKYGYGKKSLSAQKLIRKISDPIETKDKILSNYKTNGILLNGVEISNYKSSDSVYYGNIEEVIVTAEGSGYDVINPPVLSIEDKTGVGASGKVSVSGQLERIDIIDQGVDYLDVPTITISGGNGKGAVAEASLINFTHTVSFNSLSLANQIDLSYNTVTLSQPHKLRDGERIFYETGGGLPVGGLTDKSEYYVGIVDNYRVRFYRTLNDAVLGENIINLTSYGTGTHTLSTVIKRKKVASIRVINGGSGYSNKYTETSSAGIITSKNLIKVKNHGYESGDIITYGTTGSEILGLSTAKSYYVTKFEEDYFYLSEVGAGSTNKRKFYDVKEYVNLRSSGSGTHYFNYEPIQVKIDGKIGLTTVTSTNSVIVNSETIRSGFTTYVAGAGQSSFNFNYIPRPNKPGLIDVFVNGIRLSGEDYNSSSGTVIVLDSPASNGDLVEMVSYGSTVRTGFTTVTAGAGQTNFPFNYAPGFLDVYYNGLKLPLRDYEAYDGSNVILKEGATSGDNIELITYPEIVKLESTFTAQQGQTDFTFPHQIEYGLLDVYYNGIKLSSDDYDSTSSQSVVKLSEPAIEGDVVYISYYYLSDIVEFGQDFNAKIQPIFRGNINSVFLTDGGQNYGASEILNYNRQPLFTLNNGSGAELIPIINQTTGGIQDVIVKNSGFGYNSPPNLEISGSGSRAILTPIVKNGAITEIIIINSGVGYDPNGTTINVSSPGLGAKFESKTKLWQVNECERLFQRNKISNDDSLLIEDYSGSLKYTHLYAPRSLREQVFGTKSVDGRIVFEKDLIKNSIGNEIDTSFHSPIIGWAYDGNPIYGPYAYDTPQGGVVRRMVSSYTPTIKAGRPPLSIFPLGFFLDDWIYDKSGDLDEHNGRFCITPEYPKGTYAYFATISDEVESNGPFDGYKKPVFPYLIGPSFHSKPIEFNFSIFSNQESINISNTGWFRNTSPYNLTSDNTSYQYITDPNKIKKQTSIVKYAQPGSLEDIDIVNSGSNYKVNDRVSIIGDRGRGAFANVSKISGKKVTKLTSNSKYIEDVSFISLDNRGNFIGIAKTPHQLNDYDVVSISGLSTYRNDLQKSLQIRVLNSTLSLTSGINSSPITGIVTYLNVSSLPKYPYILENDILQINDEEVKILNIDGDKSRIRILREQNSTVGTSHSVNSIVQQKSRRVGVKANYKKSDSFTINRQFYFDPTKSIAIGSTWGVGITSTLFLDTIEHKSPISFGIGNSTTLYFQNLNDRNNFLGGGYVSIVNSTNSLFSKNKLKVLSVGSTSIVVDFDTSSLSGSGVTGYLNSEETISIPTRTVYIPNHGLETGNRVIYSSNGGSSLLVQRIFTQFQLSNNQELFVKKINNDLVSFAQSSSDLQIDRNILQFVGYGTGSYHSFETVKSNILNGQLERNEVTIFTSSAHDLSLRDNIEVNVNVGVTTTIKVVYNDSLRRTLINPRNFIASNVNVINDTIRINDHGFYTGQKLVFTSNSSTQLVNNEIYYAIVFDRNKIRLAKTYYESKLSLPIFINFTTSFAGSISPVNPQISFYKNQKVKFDLSDSSLSYDNFGSRESAFDFNLYTDLNFENEYYTTGDLGSFNVEKNGLIGVDSDAYLLFETSDLTPSVLYYSLKPKYGISNQFKLTAFNDTEKIYNANTLIKVDSVFSGNHSITSLGSTFFTYSIPNYPEKNSYDPLISVINYNTSSTNASGSISSIRISSQGSRYFDIPRIDGIDSKTGSDALLNGLSKNIGRIKTVKIEDIGFDYPTDNTIRPTVKLSNVLNVERFSSFDRIGISSAGRGYTTSPDLVVLDSVSGEKVDVILKYDIGDTEVQIIKNTKDLYGVNPVIIPVNNSNGVGINTVSYSNLTGDVTVTLVGSFGTVGGFPFNVGDDIFIENVAITGSGRGYNSSEYGYSTFKINEVDPRYGAFNPTIKFNILSNLNVGEVPGQYDPNNSSGRVISKGDFPLFNITLIENDFLIGEKIVSNKKSNGFVDKWNPNSNLLKILSPFGIFDVNEEIEGQTSGTKALVKKSISFESEYKLGSSSKVEKGWKRLTGFLNNDIQRIQDSDYYQYFSYSLKSKVPLETWDDPVQSLNHPAGYKKFSNLIIDTTTNIGVNSNQNNGDVSSVSDLVGIVDTQCYQDWDLVDENFKYIMGEISSDEIIFNSRLIQNYFESVSNKVVKIDDVSSSFNSTERVDKFSTVDKFPLSQRFKKYITYVKDKRFTNERQIMLVTVLHDGERGYLNQYGRVETAEDLGSFDFSIRNLEGNLDFYPIKTSVNNYSVSLASYNNIDSAAGIGSTSVGSIASVYSTQIPIQAGFALTSVQIVSIAETYRSAKVLVSVSTTDNQHEYDEISILRDNNRNVAILDYGQLTDETSFSSSTSGFGTYDVSVPRKIIATDNILSYFSTAGVTTSSGGSGIGPYGGFNIGAHTRFTGTGIRYFTLPPIDSRNLDQFIVNVIVGNDNNGGEKPDSGETLDAYYSIDNGSTFVYFGTIASESDSSSLQDYKLTIPDIAKTANTLFRVGQYNNTGSDYDNYGIKSATFNTDRTIIDFYPRAGIAGTVNTLTIGLGITQSTGIGSMTFNTNTVETIYTQIPSSPSPSANRIAGWSTDVFNAGYLIVGVEDASNNEYEFFEVIAAQDDLDQSFTEYGNIQTSSGLGTVGIRCIGENLDVLYTPNPNIDVNVRVWQHSMRLVDNFNSDTGILFNNASINSGDGTYTGTDLDIKRDFNLQQNGLDIFQKYFNPTTDPREGAVSDNGLVKINENLITIGENFFVTGEEVVYNYPNIPGFQPIGIASTTISGITTNIMPEKVFIVKVDDLNVKVASSATDALAIPPSVLTVTSTGIGVSHRFISKKQNQRVLITIDDLIQSPIVATSTTSLLTQTASTFVNEFSVNSVFGIKNGDLIKIDQEICLVDSVNSETNKLSVRRSWMGTNIGIHTQNSLITKIIGNYNIIDSTINFADSPYGPSPIGTSRNEPDERDWTGITTSSKFGGRAFIKSSDFNTSIEPYSNNYIFDDVSNSFTGIRTEFGLTYNTGSGNTSVSGISTDNAFIILNGIMQSPSRFTVNPIVDNQYLNESLGVTSVFFNSAPTGGEIVSVGSTPGFGYQPLVSAGGTALVSISGTISSISIGNSGSGYRSGIQTSINVSVATSSVTGTNILVVAKADVSDGHVTNVTITNPGSGYTSSNPPIVIFDDPFSYENLSLDYIPGTSGLGTGAKVSVVVGQGSSIIDFDVVDFGIGYKVGDKLTFAVGGSIGVPTDTTKPYNLFELEVTDQYQEQFSGWSVGNLTVFDNIDGLFDGFERRFPLRIDGVRQSIIPRPGSGIDVAYTLLIFINGVLQTPGESYIFNGGSTITFTEAPREGDNATVLFYQGNKEVDVINKDILENIKVGDTLQITSDIETHKQEKRSVFSIESIDISKTNTYSGSGILTTSTLRPVTWCKQRSDKFINGFIVPKNREEYESLVYPLTNIIKEISISDTEIFVENVKTFFDSFNENPTPRSTQTVIEIIDQDTIVSASATASISSSGAVTSLTLTNAGYGYTEAPQVFFESPIGLGTTSRANASTTILDGKVTSITLTNSGTGYVTEPNIIIEPPYVNVERIERVSYSGDFGIISGIKTTSVGLASTGLTLDLFIPLNSPLRDSKIVGSSATSISGIQTGYYFVVSGTSIGSGTTSLSSSGQLISVGENNIDNVYEVISASVEKSSIPGIGITDIVQVVISLSDYGDISDIEINGNCGDYSWGRISATNRNSPRTFEIYNTGLSGIQTSPLVRRLSPLENFNYKQ